MTLDDTKIILITMMEWSELHRKDMLITSHGVCNNSLEPVIVSNDHPKNLGGVWDVELGEWVIEIDPMDHWGRLAK